MRIVERREHSGRWWGRRGDGAWLCWDPMTNGWQGPLTPPWAAGPTVPPELPPPGRSRHRVDVWWNQRFPPFSRARLGFLIAVAPVMSAVTESVWSTAHGTPFSLPRSLFICFASVATIAIGFTPAMRERAASMSRPDPRAVSPPPRPTVRRVGDFAVALPFAYAVMVITHLAVVGTSNVFAPTTLLTHLVAGAVAAAMIALGTSVWSLVIVSVVGGAIGWLAVMLLSAFTFSTPSGVELTVGWILGSLVVFTFLWPAWSCARRLEARGVRLPIWLVMGTTLVLVAAGSVLFVAES